jgi:ribosomal protein L37AE/L43A
MSDSPRASVIYYCPFCAEEDLRPVEEPRGAWRCNACARVFTVQMASLDTTRIPGRLREEAELQHRGGPA